MKSRLKSGTVGWAVLAGYVFWWDYQVALKSGGETLSSAFGRAFKHPIRRWPVIAVWAITTAHLFSVMPPRVDPFIRAGQLCGYRLEIRNGKRGSTASAN